MLAIGGTVFLLAFMAFRQVSINRRDTQRRNDAGRIASELNTFFSNGGNIQSLRTVGFWKGSSPDSSPADPCGSDTDPYIRDFTSVYLCESGEFVSPDGTDYQVLTAGATLSTPGEFYFISAACDNLADVSKMAVRMKLEKGEVCRQL